MIDRDIVRLRAIKVCMLAGENLNLMFYVVGLNQLQTTRRSHLNFELHSIDVTYVKN